MTPALTLYTRSACHLCEEMRATLEPLGRRHGFSVAVVDVDADPGLVERYGARVPVLVAGGAEICSGKLDTAALAAALASFGDAG